MAKIRILFVLLLLLNVPAMAVTEDSNSDMHGLTYEQLFDVENDALVTQDHHEYASTGHADEHHATTSGLPQLDLTWFPSQIFWLGIAFSILYIAFSTKVIPAIGANLNNRDQTIQNDLAMAEKLTEDAGDFQKSYETSLQNARMEATSMMVELDNEMKKDHEQKQSVFLKKTETQILDTKKRLEKMTANSMKDIELHIEETALMAAKNIAGIDTDGKAVKAALKAVNSNIKAKAA